MISLKVKHSFDAAHRVACHGGACSRLHGHTYNLEATFALLDEEEFVDFGVLSSIVKEACKELDHGYINEVLCHESATAERIVSYIAARIREALAASKLSQKVSLREATLWETAKHAAVWSDEEAS